MGGGRRWRTLGSLGVLVLFSAPLLIVLPGSLREPGRPPPRTLELLPDPVVFSNYEHAVDLAGLGRATVNSLLVAAFAVPLSVLVASWAGFALVQLPRRLARVVIGAAVVPLIAPALVATSPIYALVYYVSFRQLPRDLWDACRLEGMSPLRTWRRVAMPLVRPVTAAVAALAFVLTWANFLDPLVYVYRRELFTVPLALRSLATLDPTNYPLLLAGAVIATAPVVAVFLIAQRWFLHEYRGPGWLGR